MVRRTKSIWCWRGSYFYSSTSLRSRRAAVALLGGLGQRKTCPQSANEPLTWAIINLTNWNVPPSTTNLNMRSTPAHSQPLTLVWLSATVPDA